MKNLIFSTLLLLFSLAVFSQNFEAEGDATDCLNKALTKANKDINYLRLAAADYEDMLALQQQESFYALYHEVNEVLEISEILQNNQLNTALLLKCLESANEIEAGSSYSRLLRYFKDSPSGLSSSNARTEIEKLISKEDREKRFYRVFTFLLFHSSIHPNQSDDFGQISSDYRSLMSIAPAAASPALPELVEIDEDELIEEEIAIEEEEVEEEIFIIVDQPPVFPGGETALADYLRVSSAAEQGKIFVQFVVDKNGEVVQVEVVRGLNDAVDNKAVELIKRMPLWEAGQQRGQKVSVRLTKAVVVE